MSVTFSMTAMQRESLLRHLFPDDGCEAVALALCGRASHGQRQRLIVRKLDLVPYAACSIRAPDRVTWPTDRLVPLLGEVAKKGYALVKIHGHTGYDRFSSVDDASDRQLFQSVYSWADSDAPHGSAIVMRDGRVFGRIVGEDGSFTEFSHCAVVGDDIEIFSKEGDGGVAAEYGRRVAQTFGARTFQLLRRLRIAVIGCSGTGSPVIEQLARNCVGALVLVDPDVVEVKNLNRILGSTMEDARRGTPKVEVAARSIAALEFGTEVTAVCASLFDRSVIREVSTCDVIFGCLDSIDGRFILNKLASFYSIPYIDLGVRIDADGEGGVTQVCGSVHYLKPGGSSLLSRHTFSLEQVRAAGLQRTDPSHYQNLLEEGYIRGVQEDRPAVVQLNSLIASLAVNELLARVHPYRIDPNEAYAVTRISLSHGIFEHEPEGAICPVLSRNVGRGDIEPPLDWVELSQKA